MVIASDLNIAARLRRLRVAGQHVGLGQGNPLRVVRARRSGIDGDCAGSLVYLNTRVSWPELTGAAGGLVVVDATSLSNDARRVALRWAHDHAARGVVVVGDLGDTDVVDLVSSQSGEVAIVPFTWTDLASIEYTLGVRRGSTPHSSFDTSVLLRRRAPHVRLVSVADADVDDALAEAFDARFSMPPGPRPAPVAAAVSLLNAGVALLADPDDYRRAAALDLAPATHSPTDLLRAAAASFAAPPGWEAWTATRAGALQYAAVALWRRLDADQPKLEALWRLLGRLEGDGRPVVIRCPSRAAVAALNATLRSDDRHPAQAALWERMGDRVQILRYRERRPWGSGTVEVLAGAAPWTVPLLVGGEADEVHVLCYGSEATVLRAVGRRFDAQTAEFRRAVAARFGAAEPEPAPPLLPEDDCDAARGPDAHLDLPDLSLEAILERVASDDEADSGSPGPAARSCVPVHLIGGRTWWATSPDQLVVVSTAAGGTRHVSVAELLPGDQVVVPSGDGDDTIHGRLVAAAHRRSDVAGLDAVLGQFHRAAATVLGAHPTQRAAVAAVRAAGASAAGQLPLWASGETLAPMAAADMAATFAAAGLPCPDLRLFDEVAATLRQLHRMLGKLVNAMRAGRDDRDAVTEKLADLIGDVAWDIVDEFTIDTVEVVGAPREVPGRIAGRITKR